MAIKVMTGSYCEYAGCKTKAKIEGTYTNFATKEKRKVMVCKKHLPSLIDDGFRNNLHTDFFVINKEEKAV